MSMHFTRASRLQGSARSEAGFERGAMNAHENVDLADGIFENLHDIGAPSMSMRRTSSTSETLESFTRSAVGKEMQQRRITRPTKKPDDTDVLWLST